MSSIVRLIGAACLMFLYGCAGFNASALHDRHCPRSTATPPRWIDRTAFELNLPQDYYYGKGSALKREDAIAQAYADLARSVSVKIFSRDIIQQTDQKIRAESVAQAISDVQARGIQTIGEWQAPETCHFHMMVRVAQHIAASWKTQAQSYFVYRPGLGRVRRPYFEIHKMRYREIGRPKLAIQWDQTKSRLQQAAQNGAVIFETALRRALQKSGIQLTANRSAAKNILVLSVPQRAPIVIEAHLIDSHGQEIAQYAMTDSSLEKAANSLILNLLNAWLTQNTPRY